jgi:hypothetical protein
VNKEFSFYEFAGVLAPGALVLFGLGYVVPALASFKSPADLQLGGLGVFVVLAYVAGHLTQAVGNAIEWLYWACWRGMPTQWVRRGALLSKAQIERIGSIAKANWEITELSAVSEKEWFAVGREMNARLVAANRTGRLDVFNGNYGLTRGIAAATLVILAATALLQGLATWKAEVGLAVVFAVALFRMHRFGVHYARELYVQYLDVERAATKPPATGATPTAQAS